MIVATFANSAGWIWNGPTSNHARMFLCIAPIPGTRTRHSAAIAPR